MEFDLLIVGGGLAGASLACALRGSRLRVGLVDRQPPRAAAGWDARIYALSPANVEFLRRCGVWDLLPADRLAAIARMEVCGDGGGRLQFDAYESGLDALAWTVEAGRLASELWETARRQSNIQLLCPAQPAALRIGAEWAELGLEDGRALRARLVVGADGADSWVRGRVGLDATLSPYGECGVVANFATSQAHHGTAFQWFRHDGVLAYLPLPGNQISIVWSTADPHAAELVALPAEALCRRVEASADGRLGKLAPLTAAAAFPLRLLKVATTVAPRAALIGDAAHAVHPLSGHGINLGFQDAAVLAEVLLAEVGADCGALALLRRYARRRKEEVLLVQSVTHSLHGMFRRRGMAMGWARNVGMTMTGKLPFLRAGLARYAAGLI